ncbi:MAG: coenzyme synthetase [Thermoleophilia bacterium]|nr:coenzyme synthetase [Thermoleophilia bacterium]
MQPVRYSVLKVADWFLSALQRTGRISPGTWRFLVRHYSPMFGRIGKMHAWITCCMAARSVPAYRRFLADNGFSRSRWRLSSFPETNKDNYVRSFDVLDRCRFGKVQYEGTAVDESAGSSGKPYNWLRSKKELDQVHANFGSYVAHIFPSTRPFIINAYSMGAWATGTNTGIAMNKIGIVKNTGPDIEKIVDTLLFFGPRFDYVITAYPPFLKHLQDRLDQEPAFDWEKFRISGQVGGEPMTEALRDYLEQRYLKIRSGYGASDLTIGIAGETKLTVWLRRRIMHDQQLREAVLGPDENRLPMIFQYSPLENYMEINAQGQLVCTLNNAAILAPKVRYNVGDEGRIYNWPELFAILDTNPEWAREAREAAKVELMKMNFLILYGRADSTISYMGANIYPQDIENGLYHDNPYAADIERFCLTLDTLEDGIEQRPAVNLEVREASQLSAEQRAVMAEAARVGIIRHLTATSRDFAQSLKEDPTTADLRVVVHDYGAGPFADQDSRIKNKYLVQS